MGCYQLCLDTTNGNTLATSDLKNLKIGKKESILLKQWEMILKYAKQTDDYNPKFTYGVYQISEELDSSYKDEKTGKTIYRYKELHSALNTMKTLVKEYYNSDIVPTLFKYEFLK